MALVAIALLVFLSACESKTVGKRVAIPQTGAPAPAPKGVTGAVTADTPETSKTAAETLKELQNMETAPTVGGSKTGTFYPPVPAENASATGKDALKAKTDALMKQPGYDPNVQADTQFGARYFGKGLPGDYKDN